MLGRRGIVAGIGAAALAGARRAGPQGWPDRPLRWIVGYPPGGASDTFARLIGNHMARALGQNVVVENRPGGGAVVASDAVVRSAPDGYTLLHVDNGILVYNPALYARLPFDPDKDFQGVGFIGRFPLFIVVRPDSPVEGLRRFRRPVEAEGAELRLARRRLAASPGDGDGQAPHRAGGRARALSRRAGGDAGPAGGQRGQRRHRLRHRHPLHHRRQGEDARASSRKPAARARRTCRPCGSWASPMPSPMAGRA